MTVISHLLAFNVSKMLVYDFSIYCHNGNLLDVLGNCAERLYWLTSRVNVSMLVNIFYCINGYKASVQRSVFVPLAHEQQQQQNCKTKEIILSDAIKIEIYSCQTKKYRKLNENERSCEWCIFIRNSK